MSDTKNQTSHASAPGGPLPTRGDDAGGDGAVRGLPAKWETIAALHAENAEFWRSRSTPSHSHASSVASREGMAEAYRAAASDLRDALAAGVGRGGPVTEAPADPLCSDGCSLPYDHPGPCAPASSVSAAARAPVSGDARPVLPRRVRRHLTGDALKEAMERLNPHPALEDYKEGAGDAAPDETPAPRACSLHMEHVVGCERCARATNEKRNEEPTR